MMLVLYNEIDLTDSLSCHLLQPILIIELEMAWAAKRPANEPLTGLFSGLLTARFYFLFLIGPLMSRYQFLKSLSTFSFFLNVAEGSSKKEL